MQNIDISVNLEERRRAADAKYAELLDKSCVCPICQAEWTELAIEFKFLTKMSKRYLSVEMNNFFKRQH